MTTTASISCNIARAIAFAPGALIGGVGENHIDIIPNIDYEQTWAEAEKTATVFADCFYEFDLGIKQKVPTAFQSKTGVEIHSLSVASFKRMVITSRAANTFPSKFKFLIGRPIGLFTGHILRIEGKTWVNILSYNGQDIWI